jgi:ABC-type glycerol-3-phosphate transport system substrate-binding protein
MRRAAFSVTMLVLLFTFAPACARPAPEQGVVTISLACRDYLRSWYRELADAFQEEHPGIAIQILSVEEILKRTTSGGVGIVSSDDIVKVAHAADTFVDDARMLGDRPQDVALDLTDLAARDGELLLEDFLPAPLALFQRDGGLWGLPLEVNTMLLYYSPERFDEAGLPYPQVGWSWEDFLDAAVRLTIREGDRVVEYGLVDPFATSLLPLLVHAHAGSLVEERHGVLQARLDDPAVAEAIRRYADLVTHYGAMPDFRELDSLALQRLPHDATPGMWLSGSWYRDEFASAGIVPLPERNGMGVGSINARGAMVSAGTTHPEEAWRWVAFLSEQAPLTYSSAIPARESVIRSANTWRNMDSALAAAFQYNLDHAIDVPGTIRGALFRAYQAALEGASLEAVLAEEEARANETLARIAEASEEPAEAFAVAPVAPQSGEDAIEVRFHAPFGDDLDLYRALAKQFGGLHPEINVLVEPSSNWAIADLAAEADCFLGYVSGVQASRNSLLAIDPLLAEADFDSGVFYPTYLEPLTVDGTLWGLPLDADARLLYYSRDRFDQAGEPYPSPGWTPRDLVARALDLADLDGPEPQYGFYPVFGAYADAATYVAWLGGQLFDAQGQPAFVDPSVVEATALYAALVSGAAPPETLEQTGDRLSGVTVTWGERPGLVQSGQAGIWVDEYQHHGVARPLEFRFGVAPLPAGAVSFPATLRALYISANAADPDACWQWIAFLSAQPQAVRLLPVRRDVAASDAWRERVGQETAEAWMQILARPQAPQPPWYTDPVADHALYWFDEALAQVFAGASPTDALADAQGKASAFTSCMEERAEDEQAWRTCARQADPAITLPDQ